MFDYEKIKKTLRGALLSGNIDIMFYHLMCKKIDELKSQVPTHTYADLNMVYVPSMK